MNGFLVHVERRDLIEWSIQTNLRGERAAHNRYTNCHRVRLDAELSEEEASPMETWYADSLASANALARKISNEVPGRMVNVYQLINVFQSTTNPPTMATYSERGLVPS
jgi:hypothetical protein